MQAATPEEVTNEVRHRMATFGAGGGYILSGSHLYQVDLSQANIEAVHHAFKE